MNYFSDEDEEDIEDEEDLEEEEDPEDEDSDEGEDDEDGVDEEDLAMFRFMKQMRKQGASGMGAPQGSCPCWGVPGQQMQLRKFAADGDSDEDSDAENVEQQPQVPQEPRIEDFGGETIPDCCQEQYGLLIIGEVLDDEKVKELKNKCCRDVYSGFHRFGLRWYKFR